MSAKDKFALPEMKLPEVKFNKNGYEIRTEILEMAKDLTMAEYSAKWQGWEVTSTKDSATGQVITTVAMPQFPGIETVLATAEKMYEFVNKK